LNNQSLESFEDGDLIAMDDGNGNEGSDTYVLITQWLAQP